MNRRQFNTTALSSAALATLPVPAISAQTAATRGPLLAWASAIARAQNRASPALLAQQLKVAPEIAQGLYASLLKVGVIRAPVAGALAQAAKPIAPPVRAQTASFTAKDIERAWSKLDDIIDTAEDERATAPSSCP